MSFGGGFGGFGQNNNQQQQSTFGGGFGSQQQQQQPSTGFGSTTSTGFGGTGTSAGGIFGGGGSTGGFGSSGGFGSGGAFGAKPGGFGTTATTSSGGGLFGGGTATSGGGGFGGFGSAPASTSSPFGGGASASGGGLFGSAPAKPAFGSSNSPAFGNTSTSSPFGSSTTPAFGAPPSTALAGATGDCQGTGSVPFQAFVEKEPNSTSNQQNAFQSISFQQPYQKFSSEELRLADYAQGRRFGNASGQAGAFGTSNFGGGFGSAPSNPSGGFGSNTTGASGGMFGASSTSSPFGTSQPAQTGFGGGPTASGGGLFGAAKPATGGLFGSQPAAQPAGGLFGSSGATGGFGSGGTTTAFGGSNPSTGGGLFGNNNASKPGGFSFGNAQQPATTTSTTGFGSTPATTGGFGGSGGLFGGGNQQQQQSSNPFGQSQQPAASNPFGGFGGAPQQQSGGGLFGGAANNNNQQKPAGGLFGAPAASSGVSGLFGSQPAANNSPFGSNNNTQNTGGGLFGGAKPATGGGLFGSTNNNLSSNAGGLFGGFGNQNQNQNQNQQQQNPSGGGLFGGLNQNNSQQKPSLFGAPQQQSAGGLFGGSQTQQSSSLFGNVGNNQQQQQQQQPAQNSLFGGGSMFGGNSQQGQQTQQSLTTSISDNAAFGSSSLFSNLASPQVENPGPLATPLGSSISKHKKTSAIPMYKLNSASTSRFVTPQKRPGFGFSYSNYNTPSSASSTASTPGVFSGSTFGNSLSFTRGLGKSVSASNLRRSFNTDDSILAPGAFSTSPSSRQFGSTGSVKKLVINRSLRNDLFTPPASNSQQSSSNSGGSILKKRVSFDSNTMLNSVSGNSSPLKQSHTNGSPSSQDLGYVRPNEKSDTPVVASEMEQVKGKELAIVHEVSEDAGTSTSTNGKLTGHGNPEAHQYWMTPTKEEIDNMSRTQRQQVDLTVGCHGFGQVHFDRPVDLTNIKATEIPGGIVVFAPRTATVYPMTHQKPPRGQGLNVPSTISLTQSWPRNGKTASGPKNEARIKKHIERLKQVDDTTFKEYIPATGTWTFTVDHFTTYGAPEDDSDDEGASDFGQSTLSAPPDTPTPKTRTPRSLQVDQSFASSQMTYTESDPEDTFEFRRKKVPPGAFDDQDIYNDEDTDSNHEVKNQDSFLDERSVGSQSENGVAEPMEQDDVFQDDESVSIMDQEMAGSYPDADNTAEHDEYSQNDDDSMDILTETPGAVARFRALKNSGTPMKTFAPGNDWTNALQKTVSPQKQDRALLKHLIDSHDHDTHPDSEPTPKSRRVVSEQHGFATSIDLMNSLFGQNRSPQKAAKIPGKGKGFEWPYAKRPKTDSYQIDMNDAERAYHFSMKPSWGPDGTLVYASSNSKPFGRSSRRRGHAKDGLLNIQKGAIVSENRDVRFAKFSNEAAASFLAKQEAITLVHESSNVPFASLPGDFSFANLFDASNVRGSAAVHETLVWQLASILFDEVVVPDALENIPDAVDRIRKDNLSNFWEKLVDGVSSKHVALARSNEEKAVSSLSGHKIADACTHLINGKDFHLATLVSLIGSNDSMRKDIREQLNDWQKSRVLSEFSQPIRVIYELLAGNVCVCDGSKGVPIEDRLESFIISKRFGLDWRQSFGLRLWYGIASSETIELAIEKFAQDLAQDKETAWPQAWYVEQKIPKLWDDEELEDREDLLWGLLKIYTFDDAGLDSVLRPENSQLSPLDLRLTWQLGQALISKPNHSYGQGRSEMTDQITLAFASQLTNEGSWLDAVFVLLHLESDEARAKSLQDHLAHHAGFIGLEESEHFITLTQKYKIPRSWIWEAKALYMRSVKHNSREEVTCLIKAGSFNEAHRTFIKNVAPTTIVEMDYDTLRKMLDGFQGKQNTISDWHLGGEIYEDFLQLFDSQKRAESGDLSVVSRLLAGLPAMVAESRNPEFMETVAVETMGDIVAKAVVTMRKKGEKSDLHKILRLPLTEDKYLKHTVDLSLEYYRGVMASGRRAVRESKEPPSVVDYSLIHTHLRRELEEGKVLNQRRKWLRTI